MTLQDGIRKVYMLLDEYSSGGSISEDPDIALKMRDFFDIAQKDMANFKRIIREVTIDVGDATVYELPSDCAKVFRVWIGGVLSNRYVIRSGGISFPSSIPGTVTVEYFALPETISSKTPNDYVFEVSEEAAQCLPFFVAAQNLMADLVVDYSAFLQMYYNMRNALDVSLPSGSGTGGVRQTLFRRK
ncbi:MAG: hypothetical protein IKM36_06285 [Oscillospiraceae bacterium]|nr:hypothetical protein [Oscillospiraceae bacterium]